MGGRREGEGGGKEGGRAGGRGGGTLREFLGGWGSREIWVSF